MNNVLQMQEHEKRTVWRGRAADSRCQTSDRQDCCKSDASGEDVVQTCQGMNASACLWCCGSQGLHRSYNRKQHQPEKKGTGEEERKQVSMPNERDVVNRSEVAQLHGLQLRVSKIGRV